MICNGKQIVSFKEAEDERGAMKWRYALGDKPYFKQMQQHFVDYWHGITLVSICIHAKGYFPLNFVSAEDGDSLLDMRQFSFNYKPF